MPGRQYMRSFSQATMPNAGSEGGFAKVESLAPSPQSKCLTQQSPCGDGMRDGIPQTPIKIGLKETSAEINLQIRSFLSFETCDVSPPFVLVVQMPSAHHTFHEERQTDAHDITHDAVGMPIALGTGPLIIRPDGQRMEVCPH